MTKRRVRSLVLFSLLLVLLLAAGLGLRNLILNRVTSAIRSSLNYAGIHLSAVPPTLVLDDVRTVSSSPFFSARRVEVRFSVFSLLTRTKSLRVVVDNPVLRVSEAAAASGGSRVNLGPLPFSVESGVIRDGEFYYYGAGRVVSAKGIKAVFRQKNETLDFRLASEDVWVLLDELREPLTGTVTASGEAKGDTVVLREAIVAGPDFVVKTRGALTNLHDPEFEFQTSIHVPMARVSEMFKLPFRWTGRADGDGVLSRRQGRWSFRTECGSRDLTLNEVALGNVEGDLDAGPDGGRVSLAFRRQNEPRKQVDIFFGKEGIRGDVQGVFLDAIIKDFNLPWPVGSPVWGDFSFENAMFRAKAEFRDETMSLSPGRFPFRGAFDFIWDGKKSIHVASQRLETTFGTFSADGDIDIGRSVQVTIGGEVSDVRQGRTFTELILRKPIGIPEIRGRGKAEIKILGDYKSPQVKIDFALAPGGYDQFNAASAGGLVEIVHGDVTGIVKIADPEMRGDINLAVTGSAVDVRIRAEEANVESVLPKLGLRFPLTGRASGEFTLGVKNGGLTVKGMFASPGVVLAGQDFRDVRGALEWSGPTKKLSFSEIQADFYGGRIRGAGSFRFDSLEYEVDGEASDIDLSALSGAVGGRVAFNLKGRGMLDKDPARGKLAARNVSAGGFEHLDIDGDVTVGISGGAVDVKLDGVLNPGRNDFSATLTYPQPDGSYAINVKGRLANFDLIAPWPGIRGEVNYLAEIRGVSGLPQITAAIDIKGPIFPFPKFAQALTDYSAFVYLQNGTASIRSFQGKFGGGDVGGSGEIRLGHGGVESFDIRVEGKNMVLAFLERARALADGSFRLIKDATRFSLSGDVFFRNLTWQRELSEKLSFTSEPTLAGEKKPGLFDGLDLDIRLRADDSSVIENSLGRIQGRFDLTISGNVGSPVILGDIEGLRGTVNFQDQTFRLLKARLSFFNPAAIEPYLDFQGETILKDYRVTFSLSGLVDRLKPEFTSSPPLPSEDVLALLAMGESFKRTYSYDTSSQIGTGALLSSQITEAAKKQAERLFSLDRFSISPFVLGASTEMTARLTVGKKISRNIILLYSTNLTSQREEIARLEWEFSEGFSLVGMRDEWGRISFDAKIRKRF